MRKGWALFSYFLFLSVLTFGLTGCTLIFQKGRKTDVEQITKLQDEYSNLQNELSELERAKAELEERLRNEIASKEVTVQDEGERGLVITFVAEVLFDSGKAVLRSESFDRLDKVASVLNTTVRSYNIGIEGHTDNQPIKYSGWTSNWELSAARALSVVHYMIDEHNLEATRLSGIAFGEFHPISSNDTAEGRQKNRRVEIVILPKVEKKSGTPGQ